MSNKQRDALNKIGNISAWIAENCNDQQTAKYMNDIIAIVQETVAEPLRNCDVGTVDEQEERFQAFCNRHTVVDAQHCNGCPINNIQTEADCVFVWSQMPYEETKGETK